MSGQSKSIMEFQSFKDKLNFIYLQNIDTDCDDAETNLTIVIREVDEKKYPFLYRRLRAAQACIGLFQRKEGEEMLRPLVSPSIRPKGEGLEW